MATVLITALLVFAAAGLIVTVAGHITIQVILRRRRRDVYACPPISVLKPMKGCDDGLYENLLALAQQDYPEFEIICGTADPADPALEVVHRVQREFPDLRIAIVSGNPGSGLNPKVANLRQLVSAARHEHWLISDSNVRPKPDYLRAMASELADPEVGLVQSVLVGVGEDSTGAALENLHLNTWVASTIITADAVVDHACVIGKSMLFRKQDLERVGGFYDVRDILAEDYVLGQRFERAGMRVALSPHPLPVVSARRSIQQFASRHLRWGQMRRRISLSAYLAEPLLNPVPLLALTAVLAGFGVLGTGIDTALAVAASAGIAIKYIGDLFAVRALRGYLPPLSAIVLAPLKDVLILGIWMVAIVYRTIYWRGNRMRIGTGSTLSPMPSEGGALRSGAHLVWRPTRAVGRAVWFVPRGLWRVLRRRVATTAGTFEDIG